MHTITSDPYTYLHRTFGIDFPKDLPTPNESRAISEIHRCRRMHTALIDFRQAHTCSSDVYHRSRHILVTTIRTCCEVIRSERKARNG